MKLIIIGILLTIIFFVIAIIYLNKGVNELRENYKKPDTTIVFKNGKWDTTIVIKQVPFWLK